MKNSRKQLVVWLFENTQRWYTRWFKRCKPWNVNRKTLLNYPQGTLGKALGQFLLQNDFHPIPKVERHDVYHVLTGYGTAVEEEVALQYLCFGNGKRSFYLFGVIVLGSLLLPEYAQLYYQSYIRGKYANAFHHLEYEKLLQTQLDDLQAVFFPASIKTTIKS